jgi:hypothetical protein
VGISVLALYLKAQVPGVWLSKGKMNLVVIALYLKAQVPDVWLSEGKMNLVVIALYLKAQVPGVWLREGNELGGHTPVPEGPGCQVSGSVKGK